MNHLKNAHLIPARPAYSSANARQAAVGLCLVVLVTATVTSCGRGETPPVQPSEILLADALPKAVVTAPSPEHVLLKTVAIGGQEKPAIFMHPDSRAEFPELELGHGASVTLAVGLQDAVQEKTGDGVDFTLSIRSADGAVAEVWSKYLDSRANAANRGWQSAQISLEKFAGQKVRLILGTSSGQAGDTSFDWAFWGDPRILLGKR